MADKVVMDEYIHWLTEYIQREGIDVEEAMNRGLSILKVIDEMQPGETLGIICPTDEYYDIELPWVKPEPHLRLVSNGT